MDIQITAMCWINGKRAAHETVELDERQLLDVLRGAKPAIFKTPVADQQHWELREVRIA